MSIATAITAAQGKVAAAYTAVSNKGGTLPATQNLSNLPTAINSITTGGSSTKHGISIDSVIGEVVNGVLNAPSTGPTDIVLSGFSKVAGGVLAYKFYFNTQILSFSAPEIVELQGSYTCSNMLAVCTRMTTLNLNGLTTISNGLSSATAPCYHMCSGCSVLATVGLNSLANVGSYGLFGCFANCPLITTISLPALTQLGSNALGQAFYSSGITQLTLGGTSAITFGASPFGSGSSNYMFYACAQDITVNAPAANQAEIEAMTGYPNFGCTGTVTWNWVS